MAPLYLPTRQLNCDETLLLADCAELHKHNVQSAQLFDGWIQKNKDLDGMGIDKGVPRRTIVLATDASNQHGEDRGILARKPVPLDVADDILLKAKELKTDYDLAVIAELKIRTSAETLVWVFQSPTSVEKGEWILFHATSSRKTQFKDVKLNPVVSLKIGDQIDTPVTLHTLATCLQNSVKCSISTKSNDTRAGSITAVSKAIMAKATDRDDSRPKFSLDMSGSSIQIHGPPDHLQCPESFCQDTLAD